MQKTLLRQKTNSPGGFTLIEILMVAAIIGVMLAVIIPRAFRAQVDTKYSIVRQTAAEMGKWGMTWAERNLEAQAELSANGTPTTCRLNNYIYSLRGYIGDQTSANNWTGAVTLTTNAAWDQGGLTDCRGVMAADLVPMTVEAIMPEDKKPKNPFNGVSYFEAANDGSVVNAGVLALVSVAEGGQYQNYYFVYLGTDSTGPAIWTAGMGSTLTPTLSQARNGVFMARLAQN